MSLQQNISVRFNEEGGDSLGAINMYGVITANQGITHQQPRTLDHYALVYVLDGQGELRQAGGRWSVESGTLFLLFPGVPHSYTPEQSGWHEIYLGFFGPVFDLWQAAGHIQAKEPIYTLRPVEHWSARLRQIPALEGSRTHIRRLGEVTRLQQFLSELLSSTTREEDWLAEATLELETGTSLNFDYEALARRLGLSYERFRKRFREHTGTSPHRYRSRWLLEQIADALLNSEDTLAELADRHDFTDEFHLAKRFKQFSGLPPGQFRKQHRS